ncbi:AAA family ATPase [Pseudomonas chlororaphis]|uniref:AAA family ATPase n=1 Tax=Pseudomonas chlororaphis TaxID=587753 RepID=UPI001B315224|nr:AAA family ATPase [Pseudomonas chlororaphis]MBP5066011.1 metallophosphoesterase [Pseudomonas chlororaphis]QTT95303.1 metallophosphoesterase [Pseudomonas chlororaphis]
MPNHHSLHWLHLSDIHFHKKTAWSDSHARRKLLEFLTRKFQDGKLPKPQLIFCTGDIAFGQTPDCPMTEQYGPAKDFFNQLLACCGLERKRLFVVPGNHDVNRKKVLAGQQHHLRAMAKASMRHTQEISSRFDSLSAEFTADMKRMEDYGVFTAGYLPHLHDPERHLYARQIDLSGIKVGIAGFNSAWSCYDNDDKGQMWLGADWQFNHMNSALEGADLKIGLIHHPRDWFNQAEIEIIKKRKAHDFQFWLHGHSHNPWLDPGQRLIKLEAGAIGADTDDQFGFNLVSLDLQQGRGVAHLFEYKNGWKAQTVADMAEDGLWPFEHSVCATPVSSVAVPDSVEAPPLSVPDNLPTDEIPKPPELFGRDKLISTLTATLKEKPSIALYGLSGNGKTTLIKALHRQAAFQGTVFVDIHSSRQMTAGELFRRLLDALNNRREDPLPPSGTVEEQAQELKRLYPHAQNAFVWIDGAHLLLESSGWRNPEIRTLLTALSQAFPDWKWAYELSEKPEEGSFGRDCAIQEIPGLDRAGLASLLAARAPQAQKAEWTYSGNNLRALYQWLGGGQGGTAHTLAIELLATIAAEKKSSPLAVYQNLRHEVIERLDEKLLSIIHDEILGNAEQRLLKVLALYRNAIPQDHADYLEDRLGIQDAWQNLRRRGLLPLDNNKDHYLHGFIASWTRQRKLALKDAELSPDYAGDIPAEVADMHLLIAHCWQRQIGRQKEQINFQRANESFYHLLCCNELGTIEEWIDHLAGKETGWSNEALWAIYHRRRNAREPIERQQEVLQLLTNIHPCEHKAQRFLGECLQKTLGDTCNEALQAFEQALELSPRFPPYLANLGKLLLGRGKSGAKEFLLRLEEHLKAYPEAIDNHVQSIQNRCQQLVEGTNEATLLRRQAIDNGSKNPAFYNEEAKYQLEECNNANEALRILDLASKRQCFNDYSLTIRGTVLEKLDRGAEASKLRMSRIGVGTHDPVLYAGEAIYQLEKLNAPEEALRLLDLAVKRQCSNDYIEIIRGKVLEKLDRGAEASELRMTKIGAGTRNPVPYADEATYQLEKLNNPEEALRLLDLADKRQCSSDYIDNIRGKVLEKLARGAEASKLRMTKIGAGTRDPVTYADEATYQLEKRNDPEEALRLLDLACMYNCDDHVTVNIRRTALQRKNQH